MAREDQSKIVDFPEREVVIGEHETPVEIVTPKTEVHANMPTVEDVEEIAKKLGGGSGDTYTKEEIDHIVETMRKGLYQEVDTTEYPTLEDFLDSDGEEGIIYLYPVGNEGNNYYQYIWETTKEWISLGTTVVDLSQYAKLTLLAPIYDSTATYSVGAKCVYNGKLYTCSTAITQAEDFNSSHWTEISVSSGFVDLSSAQTITGQKTILDTALEFEKTGASNNIKWYLEEDNSGRLLLKRKHSTYNPETEWLFDGVNLFPNHQSNKIGASWAHVAEIFADKITDANGSYSSDNVFNVINATDIVNNTLTQAQFDLITNGKPTLIKGQYNIYKDMILFTGGTQGSNYYCKFVAKQAVTQNIVEGFFAINNTSKEITLTSVYRTNVYGGTLTISKLAEVNSKAIPANPSDTTKQYKFVQKVGGNLDYVEDNDFTPISVSLSDGGTISDTTLQANIQNHKPIVLNGFTCYFSCDDGTNYQYTSMRYDANANKNHINVITINKSTWVATFHTSDLTLN